MDPHCQYQHDAETTQRDKALVHAWRRARCSKLTGEDIETFRNADPVSLSPVDDGFIVEQIQNLMEYPEPAICWNAGCSKLDNHPEAARLLKRCSRCLVVSYCSVRTQPLRSQ